MGSEFLEAALSYHSRGWSVFPIPAGRKKPRISWESYQTERASEEKIHKWWEIWPDANIGIVTGRVSGIVVVDADGAEGAATLEEIGDDEPTTTSRTGSGGTHQFYRSDEDGPELRNFGRRAPGLDFRGEGGFVVAPPSVHPNGNRYEWILPPEQQPPAQVPGWVVDLCENGSTREGTIATRTPKAGEGLPEGVEEGGRHDAATRIAGRYLKKGLSPEETVGILIEWNQKNQPPLPVAELRDVVKDIAAKDAKNPKKRKQPDTIEATFYTMPDGVLLEECFDSARIPARHFARYDGDAIEYVDSVSLEDGRSVTPYDDNMVEEGVVLLPSKAEPYENEAALIDEIQTFIHRYVAVSEFFERLSAYYTLFSWVYDSFNTLPYLRAIGDYGTGKTRFLQTVGSLCYKSIFAGGATSPSPVFRIIQKYAGTLVFDEADFKSSESFDEIVKILNNGYQSGFPVLRSVAVGRDHEPQAFRVYGPKLISSREVWKDKALESRCITEPMDGQYREDIPIILSSSFADEARAIRNKLLLFRFAYHGTRTIDESLRDTTIEPRLNQIMMPLASVITDKGLRDEFREFIREYNRQIVVDRGMLLEADIIDAIRSLNTKTIRVKDITVEVGDARPDDTKPVTPHLISAILRRKLRIPTHRGREGAFIENDEAQVDRLARRYGVLVEGEM